MKPHNSDVGVSHSTSLVALQEPVLSRLPFATWPASRLQVPHTAAITLISLYFQRYLRNCISFHITAWREEHPVLPEMLRDFQVCFQSHVTLQITKRSTNVVVLVIHLNVFLLFAASSCELSNAQIECWKTRTLCICEAFPQSGFFCGASDGLNKL